VPARGLVWEDTDSARRRYQSDKGNEGAMIDRRLILGLAAALVASTGAAEAEEYAAQREHMVRVIEIITKSVPAGSRSGPLSPHVREVMRAVPRHAFVPEDRVAEAYEDRPLPIGYGQTISQPFMVALMTDLLNVEPDDVVFELGTGSGYQAAVLSGLVREVYTVEIVEPLAESASERLARLGYDNVTVRAGDGYYGWEEHAPFDAIVVTAAGSHVPPPLIAQLRPGGRMVIPVGATFLVQHLMLVEKDAAGEITTSLVLPVRFVPLTGGH
jgi:protein-L-isoaspartate(D-aspartate) O-methyltransferase